jgi:hypothetical protein
VRERDKALTRKVGRYYLQYKNVVNLKKLLLQFGAEREVEVDQETLDYLRQYILYVILKVLVRSAEAALRDRLTYREFHVDYSEEALGEVNVDLTVLSYPYGLVSYYNFREGTNAPEFGVLGCILRKVHGLASGKANEVKPDVSYFYFDIKGQLRRLEKLMSRFPEGHCREPIYTDPKWLTTAYRAYRLAEALEGIKVGVKEGAHKEKLERKELLKLILWKLYELYVFYLVVLLLERKGFKVRKVKVKKAKSLYVAERGDERFVLLFNAPLGNSRLKRVDEEKRLDDFKGRPDISLVNGRPIIFECKYSTSVSYITAGRFKVMAYTYEYDPLVAALVYPGLEEVVAYDRVDRATINLLEKVEGDMKVFVDFVYNGHKIYVVKVDPLRDDPENLQRLSVVLEDALKGGQ